MKKAQYMSVEPPKEPEREATTFPGTPDHFESPRQHAEANVFGMWIFLATEMMMFGGLFCGYAVYRANHPEVFIFADTFLDKNLGAINTIILLTSSFTMTLAHRNAQLGVRKAVILCVAISFLLGCCFMGVKFVEYEQKWKHGLLWGEKFHPVGEPGYSKAFGSAIKGTTPTPAASQSIAMKGAASASASSNAPFPLPARGPQGLANPSGKASSLNRPRDLHIFFTIYFAMTGLHAIHIFAGLGLMIWLILITSAGRITSEGHMPVTLVGMYWHLVDAIWIFLFPLLYLVR